MARGANIDIPSFRRTRHPPMCQVPVGLLVYHLKLSVMNSELPAEWRDENVGTNTSHRTNSFGRGGVPFLATQQGVGILSKRWHGGTAADRIGAIVDGPFLTGANAPLGTSRRLREAWPATVNTKTLQEIRKK